jgi:hypothetical protein
MVYGLPPSVSFPAFLALPLGLFQIWYMVRIAGGMKPNWMVMTLSAVLTFGFTAYLLTFTFWTK